MKSNQNNITLTLTETQANAAKVSLNNIKEVENRLVNLQLQQAEIAKLIVDAHGIDYKTVKETNLNGNILQLTLIDSDKK